MESNPEWEDLYERLQKLDATIAAVVQDVPVPSGLASRLATALAAAVEPLACAGAAGVGPGEVGGALAASARRAAGRWSWRCWLPSVAGVAAAAVVLVAALVHQRANEYSPSTVMERAVEMFNGELRQPESPWRETLAPRSHPFSAAVRLAGEVRWRPIAGLLGTPGLAYQMRLNDVTAVLYVLNRPVAGLPSEPSLRPARSTANCSACAWQENGLMYVLVVQGDWRAYQLFLDQPQGPLA